LKRRSLDLSNIRIKDGETLVLGGMVQEEEQKIVQKIPFLGDLPVVGGIFKNTNTKNVKSELVIMVTPRIIKDTEDALADADNL
jgi:type IV pilus assembly protein PilQ